MYPRQLETGGTPVQRELVQLITHGGTAVLQEAEDDLRLKHTQLCHCSSATHQGLKEAGLCSGAFFCSITALKRIQSLLLFVF